MKHPRYRTCAFALALAWVGPRGNAAAETEVAPPRPVNLGLLTDTPELRFHVLTVPALPGARQEVVLVCNGSCRGSLARGPYVLKSIDQLGDMVETPLDLAGDTVVDVKAANRTRRSLGLAVGIGGSAAAAGAGFVILATVLGHVMGDCDAQTDCRSWTRGELTYIGVSAGAAVVGGVAAAFGFSAFARNRQPRVSVHPEAAPPTARANVSFGPARVGGTWGVAGAGAF